MAWRDLPIGLKGLVVVAIPVLPLLVTAALYVRTTAASDAARADVERTWRNRLAEIELFAATLQAETAVRGHVLTGDRTILAAEQQARADIERLLRQLSSDVRDAEQRKRLQRVINVVRQRLRLLDGVKSRADESGTASPELQRLVAEGTSLTGELRGDLEAMMAANTQLMAERAGRQQAIERRSRAIVLVGAAAGLIGGFGAVLLFTKGVARRLRVATRNTLQLARGEALTPMAPAADEIGTLATGIEGAAQLLVDRNRQLQTRMGELETLTKELEAFSYSVSHDLRAPIRHIAGFAAMLEKSAASTFNEQQQRYVKVIVGAAGRMGQLIDDLLAFSRTGRAELRQVPVDVNAVVKDVRQKLATQVNGRAVEWRIEPLPTVYGDSALLRVVFDNLLSNAVKYTGPRPQARIEVGTAPPDGGGDEAVIYVRDNGVGFDMQYQNKLFGVFQRLHSSDEFEGTGIGLATVRRIVSRHGGRAWADSRPGEGATFFVSLPTEERPA